MDEQKQQQSDAVDAKVAKVIVFKNKSDEGLDREFIIMGMWSVEGKSEFADIAMNVLIYAAMFKAKIETRDFPIVDVGDGDYAVDFSNVLKGIAVTPLGQVELCYISGPEWDRAMENPTPGQPQTIGKDDPFLNEEEMGEIRQDMERKAREHREKLEQELQLRDVPPAGRA